MPQFEEGQPVRVHDRYLKTDPWSTGVITKIGRKYVTIKHWKGDWSSVEQFRIDNQKDTNDPHRRSFRTKGQYTQERREEVAVAVLHRNGLYSRDGSRLPLQVLEGLAAVLTEYEGTEPADGQ